MDSRVQQKLRFLSHWVQGQSSNRYIHPYTSSCDTVKRQRSTNEKLYSRIPTSVDAIIITMQNGRYNAVLLTKIVLIDLTIYVLPL